MKEKKQGNTAKTQVAASIQANPEPHRFGELREPPAETPTSTARQPALDQTSDHAASQLCGRHTNEFKEELAAPQLRISTRVKARGPTTMNRKAILISKDNTTTVRFSDEAGNVHLKPYDHTKERHPGHRPVAEAAQHPDGQTPALTAPTASDTRPTQSLRTRLTAVHGDTP